LGAIAADHLETGILAEPWRQRLGLPILKEIDDTSSLQIDQDGAGAMTPSEGPIVDAKYTRCGLRGHVGVAQHAEQGGPTNRRAEAGRELRTGRAPEGGRDRFRGHSLALGPSTVAGDQLWESLGEDGSRTVTGIASEATDSEAENELPTSERQVSDGAVIDALDAPGPRRTDRTAGRNARMQPGGA
jgi:hypothetical protein